MVHLAPTGQEPRLTRREQLQYVWSKRVTVAAPGSTPREAKRPANYDPFLNNMVLAKTRFWFGLVNFYFPDPLNNQLPKIRTQNRTIWPISLQFFRIGFAVLGLEQ